MSLLRELSALVEPISLDEAFVDLGTHPVTVADVTEIARRLRAEVSARTGMVASVGAGTSKLVAKIASDLDKPDGLRVVAPGTERALLDPLPVTRLWGVGPATSERLRRAGVHTVGDLARVPGAELVGLLGQAHGSTLARLARAEDDRAVEPEREAKSVSAEDTFERDIVEPALMAHHLDRLAARVVERLRRDGQSGRTVTVKVRRPDFTTLSRSQTLAGPTDDLSTVSRLARRLLADVDTSAGVRLLGVGVSGLADWAQAELFDSSDDPPDDAPTFEATGAPIADGRTEPVPNSVAPATGRWHGGRWWPGQDVEHQTYGRGWVWGAGSGRVTVRFETRESTAGRIRTFRADDADLTSTDPE